MECASRCSRCRRARARRAGEHNDGDVEIIDFTGAKCMENKANILKAFNPSAIWLDVQTVAELKNITSRAVRLSLKNKKYNYKVENNSYQIQLSSLEENLQLKYIDEYCSDFKMVENKIIVKNTQIPKEKIITQNQKQKALAKYDLINHWHKYRNVQKQNKIPYSKADKMFLEIYNTGILYPKIYNILNNIAIGSLYSWKGIIDQNNDWTDLLGNYKYSSTQTYRTKLQNDEIEIFLKILLSPNNFSIGKAIGLTTHILKEKGIQNIPADITFRRYAQWYKSLNYDKWVLAREGAKALKDKVEPYILRDISVLGVGQVLVADGHKLNFQVINPFTGKPCRATLVGFLDWKSGALVGYDIMVEECTQSISSALRNAILNMNHVPQFVYQDNGKAFKNKYFNGNKNFKEIGFTGIYEKLGIKVVFAAPYNAQAKVIERFFLDFQESFEKLIPSYIGTSIENKPAYTKRNEKLHTKLHEKKHSFIPTIEQALELVRQWLKFKHSQPCPNDRSKTIQEMLDSIPKQKINDQDLDDLMMATEIKHIGRNGIRFLKSDYFNDELYGIKEKAIIRYDLSDLSYIKVYSIKNEFLCRAERVTPTHPLAHHLGDIKDIEDYKQKIKKKNQLRNKTIKAVKEHFELDDIEFIKAELVENELPLIEVQKNELPPKKLKEKPEINLENYDNRPIFGENYERYEWHMKNGCRGAEDRKWLEEYIKSEEYRSIYEADFR